MPPGALWIEALQFMRTDELKNRFPWEPLLDRGLQVLGWSKPPQSSDILADSDQPAASIAHPDDPDRRGERPRVFFGPIAAANILLKDPGKRDALRKAYQVKAVEMEGSGIADATWTHERGYLVVRGICDYCDANKGDNWQRYAAMAAAAYTCALIASMTAQDIAAG